MIELGDFDFNDAVFDFFIVRNVYPPKKIPPTSPTGVVYPGFAWDMRYKIPRERLTNDYQITYTAGPIELTSGQVYSYHPLVELEMYNMPVLDEDAYRFIGNRINTTSPALQPLIQAGNQ
jgi:hypothetical protein